MHEGRSFRLDSVLLLSLALTSLMAVHLPLLGPLSGGARALGASLTAPIHRTFYLKGSFLTPSGWNGTNPGPFLSVVSGDNATIMLLSSDGFPHQWFIDFNSNAILESNETASASSTFLSQVNYLNFTFTPVISKNIPTAGNWTYRCSFHPFAMTGIIRVLPEQLSATINSNSNIDTSRVSTTGNLVIDMRSFMVSGNVVVTAVDSVSGATTFTKTYTVPGLQMVRSPGSTVLQLHFLLNVAVTPNALSSDVTLQLQGLTTSTGDVLTRQLDINGNGTVEILDASIVGSAWQTTIGNPKYNPQADFDANGSINILDVSVFGAYWQATDLR